MASAPQRWTTRCARAIMLAAMLAFMVQGILVWNAQVAAAAGLMPEPVMIGGDAHYHDPHGGNVHHHPNGDADGHVHAPAAADQDDDQPDDSGCVSICSLFAASISFSPSAFVAVPHRVGASLAMTRADWHAGTDPAALVRPPRPLRIA